jgi:hypothetical protein
MKRLIFFCLFFFLFGLCLQRLYAQSPEPKGVQSSQAATADVENPKPAPENAGPQIVHFLSDLEFWLSVIIVLFGVFVVILEYRLLSRAKAKPSDVMRVLAVTLILVGSLFLITAGYSNNQISPVSGLFGTVAGYLLGRSNGSDSRIKNKKSKAPEEIETEG